MPRIDQSSIIPPGNVPPEWLESLESLTQYPYPGSMSRLLQTTAATFYTVLGERARWTFSWWAKSRNNTRQLLRLKIEPDRSLESIASLRDPQGTRGGVFLMTHDVDYRYGYDNVIQLAELEHKRGLCCCYYFLVNAGYNIDPAVLKDLTQMGHEIGLHGYTYDLRIAYRNPTTIQGRLKKGKQILEDLMGEEVLGFRNHSLIWSHQLLDAVSRLGFLYDSGVYPRAELNGFNAFFCFPFTYLATDLYEIPVLYPLDSDVFRAAYLDDDVVLNYFQSKAVRIAEWNGVACFDHHPSIIATRMEYFSALLDAIQSTGMTNCTPANLVRDLRRIKAGKTES